MNLLEELAENGRWSLSKGGKCPKKKPEKLGGMWKKGLMQLLVLGGQGHSANVYIDVR